MVDAPVGVTVFNNFGEVGGIADPAEIAAPAVDFAGEIIAGRDLLKVQSPIIQRFQILIPPCLDESLASLLWRD